MKTSFKSTVLATLLASLNLAAQAQPGPANNQPDSERRTRMHEHMGQRAADLKAALKLTPEQEPAWNTYTAAMKPPATPAAPKPGEFDKLSTPERLDRMRELRKQREAEFDKRDAATRSFYGTLTTDQKKIFDDTTARHFRDGPQRAQR